MAAMKPARWPITLYQGDNRPLVFRMSAGGAPMDLTGYTIRAQIRRNAKPTSPVLAELQAVIDTVDTGRFELHYTDLAATADLTPEAAWDLEMIDTLGHTQTYLYGPVKTIPQVTR